MIVLLSVLILAFAATASADKATFQPRVVPVDCDADCGTASPYVHFMTRGSFEDSRALRVGLTHLEQTEAVIIEVLEALGRAGGVRVVERYSLTFFDLADELPTLKRTWLSLGNAPQQSFPNYFVGVNWISPRLFEVLTVAKPLLFEMNTDGVIEVEVNSTD